MPVVLSGATSGSTTIQATDAVTATLTLPSSTGTLATTNSGTPVADYWYLTTGFSNAGDATTDLTTNLSQLNFTGTGVAGSMTQSSGIFTFPQTGLYRVAFSAEFYSNANTSRFLANYIKVSTDSGSNYTSVASAFGSIDAIVASSNTYQTPFTEIQVNVTNTSTVKVKFSVYTANTININGGQANGTYLVFTRLGNSV